eukprot:1707463-Prymnesium_polylepis.1
MDDPNPDGQPWLPGTGRWDTGDRISAALVHGGMTPDEGGNLPIYSFDLAGIILNPAANTMLCAYPFDVGSLSRTCHPRGVSETCVPGCTQGGNWPGAWCDPPHNEQWPCAWRPDALGRVMHLREEYRQRNVKPNMKVWDDH